jgi:nitrous oxidase accessory protein NosD
MARSLRPVVVLGGTAADARYAGGWSWLGAGRSEGGRGAGESIQAAVDAAQPGDTIVVTGRHQENVAVTTDGITLRGRGAVLEPAATPTQNACLDPSAPADVNGICILGDVNFNTGEVIREVRDVTVSGFTIRGFSEGIVGVGAHNATFERNVALDNAAYGITAFSSTGTRMLFNHASGSDEAGSGERQPDPAQRPDLFWDQTGAGNSFRGNLCQTSTPAGLCHK